jgi:putative membrane protein
MVRRIVGLALLLALVVLVSPASAQQPAQPARPAADAEFVMQGSAANLGEVNVGRLAARLASNPDVKKFAQRVVDDHSKANTELLAIINKKRGAFRAAAQMSPQQRQLANRLAQLRGAGFDRAYMQQMVDDHQKAVTLFENQAKNGKDKELKAFAEKHLPALKDHLKAAQDIAAKLKEGGTKPPPPKKDDGKTPPPPKP